MPAAKTKPVTGGNVYAPLTRKQYTATLIGQLIGITGAALLITIVLLLTK